MVQNKQRENSDAEPFVCRLAHKKVRHQKEKQRGHENIGYDFQNLLLFHLSALIENRQQHVLREFLAAAAGENRAVRDSFIVRIGGNDHIRKCHWQTDFLDERRQRVEKCVRQLCFCLSGGIDAPDVHGRGVQTAARLQGAYDGRGRDGSPQVPARDCSRCTRLTDARAYAPENP